MNRIALRQLSVWMGFVGIMTIVGGLLSVVFSLSSFVLGVVPGIISIFLGVKLCAARQHVKDIANTPPGFDYTNHLNMLAANLNIYFKIQGILIIMLLFFILIFGAAAVFLGLRLLSRFIS